ncbi:CynX/NimT family MFS transporter [Pseudonocardia sp. TRM90224]|uniref:CynX/NimT family MFS transporter n=1 Tax=Pseudonocardia sp. TRM90224 TaxID=2812678 RepID=UPI001E36F8AF|nr:MFS transporter [Pseudonocardia sp. TRM90224]
MSAVAEVDVPAPARRASLWVGIAIVLVAINLRPAVVAVAPMLEQIRAAEGLSATAAGVLSALPVLCFGLFAPLAPVLGRRFGIERSLLATLLVLCVGFVVRLAPSLVALYVGTVLLGAAIAVGNVLLPSLIKRDFPHRTGLMTGIYTMAISAGGGIAAGVTVPVAEAAGLDWRMALGAWGLLAGVGLLCWLPQLRGAGHRISVAGARVAALRRDPVAWQVTAFMGLQSMSFYGLAAWLPAVYVGRGYSPATAGWLLSLASITAIIGSLAAPTLATRAPKQSLLAAAVTALSGSGLLIILAVPGWEVVGTSVLGIGQGACLGMALTLMAVRAPDAQHAAKLSGMAQSAGYVVAAAGPFVVGALHDLTGGWTVPLLVVLLMFVPQAVAGALAGRPRLVG